MERHTLILTPWCAPHQIVNWQTVQAFGLAGAALTPRSSERPFRRPRP